MKIRKGQKNVIFIPSIVITLSAILVLISTLTGVKGQEQFSTFENSTLGISFQYPSSWYLYPYKNGVILSSQSSDVIVPIFDKNEFKMLHLVNDAQSTPIPVIIEFYTSFTNKTLQQTSSDIGHAMDSIWSGIGNLSPISIANNPGYTLQVKDVTKNDNIRLTWVLKSIPNTKTAKQYNIAYVAKGLDYDLYRKNYDDVFNSLKLIQDDSQLLSQFHQVKAAKENGIKANENYLIRSQLQIKHNNMVQSELAHKKSCSTIQHEIDSRLDAIENSTGEFAQSNKDDLQMTLNYFQDKFKECKTWKPTTNMTMVAVPDVQLPPPIPDPLSEYAP